MSEAIDRLHREIASLKRTLNARESGIPSALTVIVRGEASSSTEGRLKAVKKALAPYGLDTIEEAREAGCEIRLALLPWLPDDARQFHRPDADFRMAGKGSTDTQSFVDKQLNANNSTASGTEALSAATSCVTDIPQ